MIQFIVAHIGADGGLEGCSALSSPPRAGFGYGGTASRSLGAVMLRGHQSEPASRVLRGHIVADGEGGVSWAPTVNDVCRATIGVPAFDADICALVQSDGVEALSPIIRAWLGMCTPLTHPIKHLLPRDDTSRAGKAIVEELTRRVAPVPSRFSAFEEAVNAAAEMIAPKIIDLAPNVIDAEIAADWVVQLAAAEAVNAAKKALKEEPNA